MNRYLNMSLWRKLKQSLEISAILQEDRLQPKLFGMLLIQGQSIVGLSLKKQYQKQTIGRFIKQRNDELKKRKEKVEGSWNRAFV